MADLRSHPEQDQEHEGASPSELLIEAARRNNTELLQEVIDSCGSAEKAAVLLNETKTVLGNHVYHEAALRGNYEIIDLLLDQEGFECDPLTTIEGDTPLHSAIRYLNTQFSSQPTNPAITTFATELLGMMLEAGSDPRIRNKANLTAYQLTDPRFESTRRLLMDALDVGVNRGDYVEEDEGEVEEGEGSASESEEEVEQKRRT